jgi:adaptin ear-binding coat-associated protein 1/2
MEIIDPATNRPLPADAIQRILFLAPTVHIYNIPPLTSTKGHVASTWTTDPSRQIFTARLRILETAIPKGDSETVKIDILLEDPSSGDLFAAAPYTTPNVVEQVLDSSRFFAVIVQGEGGRKAVLGIGFEERSEAFDFSVALQEVRKTLGLQTVAERKVAGGKGPGGKEKVPEEKRDFSLKEGQTIMVSIGGRAGKGRRSEVKGGFSGEETGKDSLGGSSLLAPSAGGGLLPPPPSAQEIKAQKRLSQTMNMTTSESIEDLGFDDGEFGEFQ